MQILIQPNLNYKCLSQFLIQPFANIVIFQSDIEKERYYSQDTFNP